jgi:hypothetical protein
MNVISVLIILEHVKILTLWIALSFSANCQNPPEILDCMSRVLPGIFDSRALFYLKQHTFIPFFPDRADTASIWVGHMMTYPKKQFRKNCVKSCRSFYSCILHIFRCAPVVMNFPLDSLDAVASRGIPKFEWCQFPKACPESGQHRISRNWDHREPINPLLNNFLIPDKVLLESVLARAFAD